MVNVLEFKGGYRFLSNFYPAQVQGPGRYLYPTVEHAYQAMKSTRERDWKLILECGTPGSAKYFGRRVELRPRWDHIKLEMMEKLLRRKFSPRSDLLVNLCRIDGRIEEGNYWRDTYWGVDLKTGEGYNHLGRLLMKIRDEYR
jgi:ribA/ribD-fused uncharacterized protein